MNLYQYDECLIDKVNEKLNLGIVKEEIKSGYSGRIYKSQNEKYCLKIVENKEQYVSLGEFKNLCLPNYSFVSDDKRYVGYVMKYLNSGDIQEYIKRKVKFDECDVRVVIKDILTGLKELHNMGYVHRDLHPGNIMQNQEKKRVSTYIIDFDQAEKINGKNKACFRFSGYNAPEIVLYDDIYDEKSEVFVAGVIMWEMLFGECPFSGYSFFGEIIEDSWDRYFSQKEYYSKALISSIKKIPLFLDNLGNASSECIDVLKGLLAYERDDRLTADEALRHEFFKVNGEKV